MAPAHVVRRMCAVAIRGFHHQDFRVFISFRPGMHHAPRGGGLYRNPADISGEEELARLCRISKKKLNHAGAENVSRVNKAKAKFGAELGDFMKRNRLE